MGHVTEIGAEATVTRAQFVCVKYTVLTHPRHRTHPRRTHTLRTLSLRSQEPQTEFVDAMKRALVIKGLFFDLYFQLPAGTNDDAAPSF